MNAKRNLQDDLRGTYARNWTVSDDHRKLKLARGVGHLAPKPASRRPQTRQSATQYPPVEGPIPASRRRRRLAGIGAATGGSQSPFGRVPGRQGAAVDADWRGYPRPLGGRGHGQVRRYRQGQVDAVRRGKHGLSGFNESDESYSSNPLNPSDPCSPPRADSRCREPEVEKRGGCGVRIFRAAVL